MKFDFQSDLPLFQQVAYQLELAIFRGIYPEGEQVPSTTEISTGYQINPATVLKGMNLLVAQEILEKRRGLGTYVKVGAVERIRQERQEEFVTNSVPAMVKEAAALGISKPQFHTMIDEHWTEEGIK